MKLGPRGEKLIKSYETLKFSAYLPTKDDVWTIGYGHTKGIKKGEICTIDQAEKWFREDVAWAEEAVNYLVSPGGVKLTQSMFDALVSLVFNVGPSCVKVGSTIGDALRQNSAFYLACDGFFLWRKQAGKDLLGLARRRAKEMSLFLEDDFRGAK